MLREWIEKGYIIPLKMLRVTLGALPPLIKMIVKHPVYIMRSNQMAHKNPPPPNTPPYKIPDYEPDMPYCKSNERYLRPTHLCNSHAKEIIAMANELGAYQVDDWEYANNVFTFVKENIKLAFVGLDREVDTLRRGSGTCIHQLSLFAALCRAGGLKARYKLYSLALVEPLYRNMVEVSPIMKGWYDALGSFMLHGTAEVYVNGRWHTADPTFTPEYEAAMGLPLAKLGDDPLGIWNYPVEGTTMLLEGLPYGVGIAWNFLVNFLGKGERIKIDKSMEEARKRGRQILQEIGKEEYDAMKREKYKAKIPKITLEKCPNLVFE
ncbi:MAG: transglutaminase family protein [Thermoplasmata archaeon]|nr:MAG: transglutaminase family protein [Thermoplasmata archaeon]